jgi:uroporphyrinogen-III synthase
MTKGLPLIVTRPDPAGAATVERAKTLGLDAYHMPLFAAHALAWTMPDPADFDALLITSAQAVRLAGPDLGRFASLPVHAVGAATAHAAAAAGLQVAMTGESGGQDLLDVMVSQNTGKILWLCGQDRSSFDSRGAKLMPLPCYAVDPVDPPAGWSALIAAPAVVLAHSTRGAARISDLAGDMRQHLILVAISAGAAAAAGGGWAAIAISKRPDDAAMLAEAHALCHKGDK